MKCEKHRLTLIQPESRFLTLSSWLQVKLLWFCLSKQELWFYANKNNLVEALKSLSVISFLQRNVGK